MDVSFKAVDTVSQTFWDVYLMLEPTGVKENWIAPKFDEDNIRILI